TQANGDKLAATVNPPKRACCVWRRDRRHVSHGNIGVSSRPPDAQSVAPTVTVHPFVVSQRKTYVKIAAMLIARFSHFDLSRYSPPSTAATAARFQRSPHAAWRKRPIDARHEPQQ